MVDSGAPVSRRERMLERLGGPPGRYVVASAVMALFWFPVRYYYTDRGEPLADVVVISGLYGAIWGGFLPLLEWIGRRRGTHGPDRADPKRGAYIGLGVGVPFYGGLIVASAGIGAWILAALLAGVLVVVVTVAVRRLQAARE